MATKDERMQNLALQARRGMTAILVLGLVRQNDTPKFKVITMAVARALEILIDNGWDVKAMVFEPAERDADGIVAEALGQAAIERAARSAKDGIRVGDKSVAYPLLAERLADGRIKRVGEEYVGVAGDGKEVSLGSVGWEPTLEIYLKHHPEPKDW